MTSKLTDLPADLAAAVRRARAEMEPPGPVSPVRLVIDDAELSTWAREFSRSGELAAAIRDVAAGDPDLAG